ncbi:MAG: hypothetical protein AAF458_13670 [Pseudomonadota bacterium]
MKTRDMAPGVRLIVLTCVVGVAAALLADVSEAREMRRFNAIRTPQQVAQFGGVQVDPVDRILPVDPRVARDAITKFIGAWNTPLINSILAENFVDKSRFLDSTATNVPRNARLRLLSIQGVQTIAQGRRSSEDGERQLISTVVATVRTQVEFNDATSGFVRLEGTNDFYLTVTELLE